MSNVRERDIYRKCCERHCIFVISDTNTIYLNGLKTEIFRCLHTSVYLQSAVPLVEFVQLPKFVIFLYLHAYTEIFASQ